LRLAGHDVLAIAEIAKGAPDEEVMERAFKARRVLITEDTDFGELIYARGQPAHGVILVRFDSRVRRAKPAAVVEAVAKLDERLKGGFVVVKPGRAHLARRPRP
jgi:predicted nuclease of predicted toxin-antitoxin system